MNIQCESDIKLKMNYRIEKIMLSTWLHKISELNPVHGVSQQIEKVKHIQSQLEQSIKLTLDKSNNDISRLNHMLNTVSPISTLDRGYAIVTATKTNSIVTGVNDLNKGDQLRIRLSAAEIDSTIDDIHEN